MNYWLHRITGGQNASEIANKLLFSENYVSIGWKGLSIKGNIDKIRDGQLDAIIENKGWEKKRNRFSLIRFICDMQKDDILIIPLPHSFSVCKIIDDIIYSNDCLQSSICKTPINGGDYFYFQNEDKEPIDLGFYRKVRIISKKIPRDGYSDNDLSMKLKMYQTNSNITSVQQSIEDAIRRFENNQPINIKEEFFKDAAGLLLNKIHTHLNSERFEKLVEWYFKTIGAIVFTPNKNDSQTEDGDIDKVAIFEDIKTVIFVQIKFHIGETNDWAVSQIKSFVSNHSDKENDYNYSYPYHTHLWVISTCDSYSENAMLMAEESDVRLINGVEFCRMILNKGVEKLDL